MYTAIVMPQSQRRMHHGNQEPLSLRLPKIHRCPPPAFEDLTLSPSTSTPVPSNRHNNTSSSSSQTLDAKTLANFSDADEEGMVLQMMVMKPASRGISEGGQEGSWMRS
ncbi:hypothetical protein BD410DRAFT_367445 [Rickenella mellea]|uniref:Uncharacterized protein n=1 Tax=Rickenella mellea TaxID=50990 RepID=A0A4Y7PYU5_9AGAM|nr:hypothetical protein BD410DRAFT_367445 [Rickenella mellea]